MLIHLHKNATTTPATQLAIQHVFDYIALFYNCKRRHSANGGLAPLEFEQQFRRSGVPRV